MLIQTQQDQVCGDVHLSPELIARYTSVYPYLRANNVLLPFHIYNIASVVLGCNAAGMFSHILPMDMNTTGLQLNLQQAMSP